MFPVGFEAAIPVAGELRQTNVLDRAATRIGGRVLSKPFYYNEK